LASDDDGETWVLMNDTDFCFQIYKTMGIQPITADDQYYTAMNIPLTVNIPGLFNNDYDYDYGPFSLNAIIVDNVTNGTIELNTGGSFYYMPESNFIGNDSFSYIASDGEYNTSITMVNLHIVDSHATSIILPDSLTPSTNNYIFHNNFHSGAWSPFVYDKYMNYWENATSEKSGGNYWSNYNEPGEQIRDMDMDYIIDDPYLIAGGSNDDTYPLLFPWEGFLPTAMFSWDPIGPATDLLIQFIDESNDYGYGVIVNWSWNFDDDNISFLKNPIHQYDYIGIYNVSLTVTDDDDNEAQFSLSIVVSADPPVANFTWNPDLPTTQDLINFTDLSIDDGVVISWLWNFSDGTTSFEQHPQHQYLDDGVYMVKLTVGYDDGAMDIIQKPVTILNVPPVTMNDTVITEENNPVWINVLDNDYDLDGMLNFTSLNVISIPSHGVIMDINTTTGEIWYNPEIDYYGNDTFEYSINDDDNATSTAIVHISIFHSNNIPISIDDNYGLLEDTIFIVNGPGILSNDYDPDNGPMPLIAELVQGPENGSVDIEIDGSFIYQPNFNYYGADSFIYQCYDGMNYSENATVNLVIENVNDAPIGLDDSYLAFEDQFYINYSQSVLDNDWDIDNSSIDLSAQLITNTSYGILIFFNNGTFTYQPIDNFTGEDSFIYWVYDGINYSSDTTVYINVQNSNDPPVAFNDSYVTFEDTLLIVNAPGILENDEDIDSEDLTAIRLSNTSHGSLLFYGDGSFEYQPNINFYGFDSFTYQAFDGFNSSNIAYVTIQVLNNNEIPIAVDDNYVLDEDILFDVTVLNGVLGNDSDPDFGPQPLSAILITEPIHGNLSFLDDGSFNYLPSENFSGVDNFIYQAYDGLDTSENATVTLIVQAINDPPVAVDNLYTIEEDEILIVQAPGFLSNDYDSESIVAELTSILIENVSYGTLEHNENGSFIYTPNHNFFGIDTFTYKAYDGVAYSQNATVTIIVHSINDIPFAVNDYYTTDEDVLLHVNELMGILANDYDPDSNPQPLIAVLNEGPLRGSLMLFENGSFDYLPFSEYSGDDHFTYRAFDGMNFTNVTTVNINVTSVNDPPIANNDTYITLINQQLIVDAPGIIKNDDDPDNNLINLSAVLITDVNNGTLNFSSNGSFQYMPDINFNGNDNFTYQLFDGISLSNIATVTIVVIEENIPPIANNDQWNTTRNMIRTISAPGVLGNDNDPEGGMLSAVLISNVSHGYLQLYSNGSFYYIPDLDWWGNDSFTYQAYDGLNYSNTATVNITVFLENFAPIAYNDTYYGVENFWLNITSPGTLYNDIDYDESPDDLTMIIIETVSHGNLDNNSDGSFQYLPSPNWNGIDQFTYQAFDGQDYSNIATVRLIIESDNIAPITINDTYLVNEDTLLNVNQPGVLSNDIDIDGPNALTAVCIDSVSYGTFDFFENGSFNYIANENWNGIDQFTYQAYDGQSYSPLTFVFITVSNVNDLPIAINDTTDMIINTSCTYNISENDMDVDNNIDYSSIVITQNSGNGNVITHSNGTITYTPNSGYDGIDTLRYTIADDDGGVSNEATVTINVSSAIIDINQELFDRGFPIRHSFDGDWGAGQSFQANYEQIPFIDVYLRKFGSPDFNLTIEIRENNIIGSTLIQQISSPSEIEGSWKWQRINCDNVTFTIGSEYFIVIPPAPSGITTSFGYEWGYTFGNPYPDGSLWFTRDSGAMWRDLPDTYEFTFRTYRTIN